MRLLAKIILINALLGIIGIPAGIAQRVTFIKPSVTYLDARTMVPAPAPGDTFKIVAGRTMTLKMVYLSGSKAKPIVIINTGGQVNIITTAWGALSFENCRYLKVTGTGDNRVRYGFKLQGNEGCLSFSEYSTDCEAEFLELAGTTGTFFGIYAKKDFGGNPPVPYPQFNNLKIHDNYIHDVTEGMYIGETKTPGMEFRHVEIYNNIVENTGRESVQLANCVEDISVHNNLFRNAGNDNQYGQSNCLQIGGNTVGKYYNNILLKSPGFGAIILGTGNIEVYSNYIENNPGCFIDDRYFTLPNTSITIRENYFRSSKGTEIIKSMNQYNNMYFLDNYYDTGLPFLSVSGGNPPLLVNTGNTFKPLPPIQFQVDSGVYIRDLTCPAEYDLMGPCNPAAVKGSRIKLTPQMIIDMVPGGSIYSTRYLADEQQLDPERDQHPVSLPWKPSKTMKYAPFRVVFDLGAEYYIDRICLHDLSATANALVSYGAPDQMTDLFTDPSTATKAWVIQPVRIVTRFIWLTMSSSLTSKINELAVYGYPLAFKAGTGLDPLSMDQSGLTLSFSDTKSLPNPGQPFRVFPNPVSDHLTITPYDAGTAIQIINVAGEVVISGKQSTFETSRLPLGGYFVRIIGSNGTVLHESKIVKVE